MLRLLETKMAILVADHLIPRDSLGNALVGGLFAVPKDAERDRLIFDRRPLNATEE